jgi:hypothetical protein
MAGAPAQAAAEGGLIALGEHCAQQAALHPFLPSMPPQLPLTGAALRISVRDPESGHRFSDKITHKQKQ